MFVCNKVDIMKETRHFDDDDEDDGDDDGDEDDDDEREGNSEVNRTSYTRDKGEIVFNQLKERNFLSSESSKMCDIFHAISAKVVRTERVDDSKGEATRRFERFRAKLQSFLAQIMKTQTRRIVQALLVLQESFVNVVQVQRSQITQQTSIVPDVTRKAIQIEKKMFESLISITCESKDAKQRIQEHIKTLKKTFVQDAVEHKIPNQRTIQREAQTMLKTDLKIALSSEQLLQIKKDYVLERFLGDMKSNILEKTCSSLDNFVQSLMDDLVSELTSDIIDFNECLTHPIVSRIMEESYGVQFHEAKAETREVLQDILNHLLDSVKEAASVALRREISGPISAKQMTTYSKKDVNNKAGRQLIVESLLETIDEKRVAEAVHEACFDCLQKMRSRFLSTTDFLAALQTAFSNSQATVQLEELRVRFTPEMRMLAVEGMALKYKLNFGPVELGSFIADTRHGKLFECRSERWCRRLPSGQCVVKVIRKATLGTSVWKQTAVDLVNMM